MIQIYTVYPSIKRSTLDAKMHINQKFKNGKRYIMQIVNKRVGIAILILDNVDFKTRIVTETKRRAFYNDERVLMSSMT